VIALSILALGLDVPEAAPVIAAVKACDRTEIRNLIKGEPHRRTQFAAAAYAEQRAIAAERATLLVVPEAITPAGQASTTTALLQVDARQKQLEDARAIERAWRDLFDEARADFLVNCANPKRDDK
jgi:hypothetical protein